MQGQIRLNPRQEEFVRFQDGCAILHAPVGTGKTLVLAERAAEAIRRGVPPERILCLTFTNRAAEEMRQRLVVRCGPHARSIRAQTFHSLCAWMLRVEAKEIGIPADFVIFDEEDSRGLLRDLFGQESMRGDMDSLYYQIEKAKTELAEKDISAFALHLDATAIAGTTPPSILSKLADYQEKLLSFHALDFADLVLYCRAMLAKPDIQDRWAGRFSLIQVDEMQDTNFAEYTILRFLAARCQNLVLAGDFAQTIYGWRGSQPERILEAFQRDFPRPGVFTLDENYRSTRALLRVANAVASSYDQNHPTISPAAINPEGEPVTAHFARTSEEEAEWIGRQILGQGRRERTATGVDKPASEGAGLGSIGILVRPNHRGQFISKVFTRMGIPHVTVEQYEFFRRQEVKDALAWLRFLLNPADGQSFQRMLLRPPRGIGEGLLAQIMAAENTGLRVVDMVSPSVHKYGDPFGQLLQDYKNGSVTVFDTETTGINPGEDEVVEIAAVRLERGRIADRFQRYLKNSRPVGDSARVHGFTDDFLRQNGEEPGRAISNFLAFAAGSHLVGHNVFFDMRLLRAQARRLGLTVPRFACSDTLELARRFVPGDSFTLASLAARLSLASRPSHHAMDDVLTTCELLTHLLAPVSDTAEDRRRVAVKCAPRFEPLLTLVDSLRESVEVMRPPEVLERVLERSGLAGYYAQDDRRMANLRELVHIFQSRDATLAEDRAGGGSADPLSALENLVRFATLARNVDYIDMEDRKVKILTVHQAKGLEFDTVFVAGLSENEFPNYGALRSGSKGEEEEVRIFYVAVTRARQRLFLTGHALHEGKWRRPSRFFGLIGDDWKELDSTFLAQAFRRRAAGW